MGLRDQSTWIREPQTSKDEQPEDIVVIQLWPHPLQNIEMQVVMSKDLSVRIEWDGKFERITPLSTEKGAWQ